MHMKRAIYRMLHAVRVLLCGTIRYVTTIAVVCTIWWYDARYLNQAFDANLALLKAVANVIDGSGKAEAAMRAFSAEKVLLFSEASMIVWLVGKLMLLLLGMILGRRGPEDVEKSGSVAV